MRDLMRAGDWIREGRKYDDDLGAISRRVKLPQWC
jgi:hypothetical protein